ncbi:MAG: hypothetical protein ACM3S2_13015 [Ignavibacteriales bacterium]
MKLSWSEFAQSNTRVTVLYSLVISVVVGLLGYWTLFINIPEVNAKAAADLEFEAFVQDLKEAQSTVKDIHKRVLEQNKISENEAERIDREIRSASSSLVDQVFRQNAEIPKEKEPAFGKERFNLLFIGWHRNTLEKFIAREEFVNMKEMLSEINAKLINDCNYRISDNYLDGEKYTDLVRY